MIASIDELMPLEGEQFVDSAYRLILGRSAEDEGRLHYLGRLRAGIDKAQLIYEIASGEEARAAGLSVPGLQRLLRRHRYTRIPGLRRIYAWLGLAEPDDWHARQLRTITFQLARIAETPGALPQGQHKMRPPHVPGGVDPCATWGVQMSLRYDADSPDVTWTGFSVPERAGGRFLRRCAEPCAIIGFWWPYAAKTAQIQLDICTDGLLPLCICLGPDVLFEHEINVTNGSIRLDCSGLSRGYNEISLNVGDNWRPSSNSRFATGIYSIAFFTKD